MARKRAPGGGRKRSPLTPRAQLTVRMPDDLRAQLVAAARQHGGDWTLTDELVGRIRASFIREREQDRDPAMRALCFLVSQLARNIPGPGRRVPTAAWRSDPFFYEAFKIAVGQLLNALAPPGRAKRYKATLTKNGMHSADPSALRYIESFENTEARAAYVVDLILSLLKKPDTISSMLRDEEIKK